MKHAGPDFISSVCSAFLDGVVRAKKTCAVVKTLKSC